MFFANFDKIKICLLNDILIDFLKKLSKDNLTSSFIKRSRCGISFDKNKEAVMSSTSKPIQLVTTNLSPKQSDSGKTIFSFIINDNRINRNGWKTISQGINTTEYMMNPVVLFIHNKNSFPVGSTESIHLEGDELIADIWFHEETVEAKIVKRLVEVGILRATSIGIEPVKLGKPIPVPKERAAFTWSDSYPVFEESSLLEISIVPVPANSGTLRVASIVNDVMAMFPTSEYASLNQDFIPDLINKLTTTNQLETPMPDGKDTTEFIRKITQLESELGVKEKELKRALESSSTHEAELGILQQKNSSLETELQTVKSEMATVVTELEKFKINEAELSSKLILAEVKTVIAGLGDKVLPVENSQDNNFKLERDLALMLTNKETMVDSDGKSLYDLRVAELQSRKPHGLTTPFSKEPVNAGLSDTMDLNSFEDRAALDSEVAKVAKEKGLPYYEAMKIVLGDN